MSAQGPFEKNEQYATATGALLAQPLGPLRQHFHAKEAVGCGQIERPLVGPAERQIARATEPAEIFSGRIEHLNANHRRYIDAPLAVDRHAVGAALLVRWNVLELEERPPVLDRAIA